MLLCGAATRHAQRFENPDVSDVEREITRHPAFGEGIRFCLAALTTAAAAIAR